MSLIIHVTSKNPEISRGKFVARNSPPKLPNLAGEVESQWCFTTASNFPLKWKQCYFKWSFNMKNYWRLFYCQIQRSSGYLQSTLPVLLVCHFWVHIFIHGTKLNHAAFGHGLCLTKLGWIAAFFSAKFANLGPESKGNPFKTMEHGTPIFTSLDIIFGECKVLKVLKHQKTRLVSLPRKATKWTEYVHLFAWKGRNHDWWEEGKSGPFWALSSLCFCLTSSLDESTVDLLIETVWLLVSHFFF